MLRKKRAGLRSVARCDVVTLPGYLTLMEAIIARRWQGPRTSRRNAIDRFSHLTGGQVLRLVPSR
jgi:hypothetical protein